MEKMQRIVPHLWFDSNARDAAEFYATVFPSSHIVASTVLPNTPSGDAELIWFKINGYKFIAINGGPYFSFNPSISFVVNFSGYSEKIVESVWERLAEKGNVLMPLDYYPTLGKYGWVEDRFGLSWQVVLPVEKWVDAFIVPHLRFKGKTKQASEFYISVFKNSRQGQLSSLFDGKSIFTEFMLEGQWFSASDRGVSNDFSFNESVSFMIYCETQNEIDYYWESLSAVPEAEQCGWLKDKYGVSWQVVPRDMDKMLQSGSPRQVMALTQMILKMKKLDIARLYDSFKTA